MKRLIVTVLLCLVATPLWAQDLKVGRVYEKISGNITGASAKERAELVVGAKLGEGDWMAYLVVRDANGGELWRSPLARTMFDARGYPIGNAGVCKLEVAGDIDGDGKGEVVVQEPQSDVRPPRFRVLRWNGRGLEVVRSLRLVEQSRGVFVWTDRFTERARFIYKFERLEAPGRCRVSLLDMQGREAAATVTVTDAGYRALK